MEKLIVLIGDDQNNNPVPASGAISFADLRDRSLNVVVDINQNSNRVWGRDRWNSNNVIVIGGGRSKNKRIKNYSSCKRHY